MQTNTATPIGFRIMILPSMISTVSVPYRRVVCRGPLRRPYAVKTNPEDSDRARCREKSWTMPNKAASDISARDSLDFGNGALPAFQIWKIVRRPGWEPCYLLVALAVKRQYLVAATGRPGGGVGTSELSSM